MNQIGRILIFTGIFLLVAGVILTFAAKLNLPLGHLPGDIILRRKNLTVYFPWVTMFLISLLLSLILNLISKWKN